MYNPVVSIFREVKATSSPYDRPVFDFFNRIKNGSKATPIIEKIRLSTSKDEQSELKATLPACTFCGTFSYRNSQSLVNFSGLACLDFDNFDSMDDLFSFRSEIASDDCLYALFISPSGKGLKAVFRVKNDPKRYTGMYRALCMKYNTAKLDSKTKDISRLCYESYDPDIHINPDAKAWEQYEEEEYTEIGSRSGDVVVPMKSDSMIIQKLQKWMDQKFTVNKGNRNNSIHTFACAMNRFGISQGTAESYLMRYEESGFTSGEILTCVKSAYKNRAEFATAVFEDYDTRAKISTDLNNGKSPKEIKARLKKDNNPIASDDDVLDDVLSNLKTVEDNDIFWKIGEKGQIKLIPHKFSSYLFKNNFMKFYPEETSNTFIFVRSDKNMIEHTTKDKIKDFVLTDLQNREGVGLAPFDFMALNTKYFANEFLSILPSVDIEIKKDTEELCYLYYRNCVVEVSRDNFQTIDYLDIDKSVWKDSVINRDFQHTDHHGGEFRSFIWYIAGQNKSSYDAFKSVIGYLLHSYKTEADNKAIVLNDEIISDEPNGRSGKGLFVNGIKHLKKIVSLNGKKLDMNSQFVFQTVKTDCQVLVFDDVRKNFPFEDLFSIITEGLEIEYKGQGAIKLPAEKSPKIVITTNYTIKGTGGSHDARKHEMELSGYFNSNYTPKDQFGHLLFVDWDKTEWSRFDNFMIQCIQYYLKNGLQLQKHKNLEIRKLMTETSSEFLEWVDNGGLITGVRYGNNETLNRFLDEYPDFRKFQHGTSLKIKTFKKWIKMYCDHSGLHLYDGIWNNQRYFIIEKTKNDHQDEHLDDSVPF